jgi:hypothetical protein
MKTLLATLALSALSALSAFAADFTPLFDGKTLTGWKNAYEWGKIDIVNGEIHLTGEKKFFVVTEKTYGDFIFEGRHQAAGRPGQQRLHVPCPCGEEQGLRLSGRGRWRCEARKWSGGLYDEGRRMWFASPIKGNKEPAKPPSAPVLAMPSSATTGTPTASSAVARASKSSSTACSRPMSKTMDASGVIAIQHHGEKGQTYKFRNLRIQELK